MKKIISLVLITSFIIGGISLSHSVKANIVITEYYPVIYVNIDDQPVDTNYVLRITQTTDGKKSRDIRTCSEGSCGTIYSHQSSLADTVEYYIERFPEEVPGSTSTSYYKKNNSKIEASYKVEDIEFVAEEHKQYDYQVDINTTNGIVKSTKINEDVYEPYKPEFNLETIGLIIKGLFVGFWYYLVGAIVLCVGAIWVYRYFKNKK